MEQETICCVDAGTSHIKAVLIEEDGAICAFQERPVSALSCIAGACLFDAGVYVTDTWAVICATLGQQGYAPATIRGVIVTNQRATLVPVGTDGHASDPAISWQDTRGRTVIDRFRAAFGASQFTCITGLPPTLTCQFRELEAGET